MLDNKTTSVTSFIAMNLVEKLIIIMGDLTNSWMTRFVLFKLYESNYNAVTGEF